VTPKDLAYTVTQRRRNIKIAKYQCHPLNSEFSLHNGLTYRLGSTPL